MIVDPKQHLTSRWTEDVWSCLKLFVETELQEFNILRMSMRTLGSEDADAWDALISDAEREIKRLAEPAYTADTRFCHLLRLLNREWFLPRSLMLMRGNMRPDSSEKDLWDCLGVGVAVVVDARTFLLHGEARWGVACHRPAVSFYHVRWIFPNSVGFPPALRDSAIPGVVVNLDQMDTNVRQMTFIPPKSAHLLSKVVLPNTRSAVLGAFQEHCESIRGRYKDVATMSNVMFNRVVLTELRQAMNHPRSSATGNEMPDTTAELLQAWDRLAEGLLADLGSIRKMLWTSISRGPSQPDSAGMPKTALWRVKMDRARALSMLSAEMTAAAVGVDPIFAVLGWNKDLRIAATEVEAGGFEHSALVDDEFRLACGEPSVTTISAIAWCVILLAGQLGWSPLPPLRPPTFGDLCEAYVLSQRLRSETPAAIRLALKAAYAREFRQPVDECPPFLFIDSAGTLSNNRPPGARQPES